MVMSFMLSFFPRGVLDEILNLIESVSEDFPSFSFIYLKIVFLTGTGGLGYKLIPHSCIWAKHWLPV